MKLQVIALYLRQPSKGRFSYLYVQIFGALSYLLGSAFLFELWRVFKKRKRSGDSGMVS